MRADVPCSVEVSSAPPPVTVIFTSPPPAAKGKTDWLRLASSAPAVLAFLGLIVYAVVRVGHDAFYARFGVTAEEVGLTQGTIVGRAALYFVFFLTIAVALVGIAATVLRPMAARPVREETRRTRVAANLLVLTVATGFAGAVVAGLEHAWRLAFVVVLMVPLALVAALHGRIPRGQRAVAVALFVLLAAWSGAVSVVIARTGTASQPGAASFPGLSRWFLFVLCVLAVGTATASLLRLLTTTQPSPTPERGVLRDALPLGLFVLALLPLTLVFVAPGAGRFVTQTSGRTFTGVFMWLVIFAFVVVGWQVSREREADERIALFDMLSIITLVCLFAGTTLYLASQRGVELANQVLAGNRITQSGFGMFSVRADIVCLLPLTPSRTTPLPHAPVVFLGQSNGQLVLFDLERSETLRARELVTHQPIGAPRRVPILVPAGDVLIRIANLIDPGAPYAVPVTVAGRTFPGKWRCLGSR